MTIDLRYSNDGVNNWNDWQSRDPGDTGSFLQPLIWRRLGRVKEERIWEFRDTSNVAADVMAASIQAESN
jgi:hypothetical protein